MFEDSGSVSIVKIALLPKLIERFNAIPIKILAGFLKTVTSSILNLDGKAKDLDYPNNLEKEETGWKTYYLVSRHRAWKYS